MMSYAHVAAPAVGVLVVLFLFVIPRITAYQKREKKQSAV